MAKRVAVVGSGPNGLSAAIAMAQAGAETVVFEQASQPGGACRTEELTLPGFRHDVGSSVYPTTLASPWFQHLQLERFGLRWAQPPVPLAHPLDGGDAAVLWPSLERTAAGFGVDGDAWRRLMAPLLPVWPQLARDVLQQLVHVPGKVLPLARFGSLALLPSSTAARMLFQSDRVRALFAGMAGHSGVPLDLVATSGVALVLGITAHAGGWPFARGGAQSITTALLRCLQEAGGGLVLQHRVTSLRELDGFDAVLLDTTPGAFLQMAGARLTPRERRPYEQFRHGVGSFKIDWALSEPVPWTNEACRQAGTLHLGGSLAEITHSERLAWNGRVSSKPYVLFAQPTVADSSRAPAGRHVGWAYCHTGHGSTADYTDHIERQVECFAPGFRDCILARSTKSAAELERWDPNLVGGDVQGGAMTLKQLLRRPTLIPYRTPVPRVFLCSASSPPGGGVHGMCGYLAAAVAARSLGLKVPSLNG